MNNRRGWVNRGPNRKVDCSPGMKCGFSREGLQLLPGILWQSIKHELLALRRKCLDYSMVAVDLANLGSTSRRTDLAEELDVGLVVVRPL